MTRDRILINGLRELGVHGVLPEEQGRPQPFEVDVELGVDLTAPGDSDHLEDTVDYAAVAEAVRRVVASERHQLLERLAARIAEVCKSDERVGSVVVTVTKLHPPLRAMVESTAVRIER
jgi:dihydroneopterin aldolase